MREGIVSYGALTSKDVVADFLFAILAEDEWAYYHPRYKALLDKASNVSTEGEAEEMIDTLSSLIHDRLISDRYSFGLHPHYPDCYGVWPNKLFDS